MAKLHDNMKRPYDAAFKQQTTSRGEPYSEEQDRPLPDRGNLTPEIDAARSNITKSTSTRVTKFEIDASVVLIGIRGVGKSSLGVLAATAYQRRLVDSERAFYDHTGKSPNAYRRINGTSEYRARHRQIFQQTLEANTRDSVIICSFADLEDSGASLLQHYSQTHPVIHVLRDSKGIQCHLQVWDEERVKTLLTTSGPILRSCASFEFFNLSERPDKDENTERNVNINEAENAIQNPIESYLTLKRVERDFLRLVRTVIGDHGRGLSYHSVYPLSTIPVERRNYSFASHLKVSDVLKDVVDLEEVQLGADCVELVVDKGSDNWEITLRDTAFAFARVRRASILPIMLTPGDGFDKRHHVKLAEYCLRLGPEYCTIDLTLDTDDLVSLVGQKGGTKVIGAFHDTSPFRGWNSQKYLDLYNWGCKLGCDILKITRAASSSVSFWNFHFLRRAAEAFQRQPLIAFETGPGGKTSKCFNTVLTPVKQSWPLGSAENSRDGEVSAKELTEALFATFVQEPMRFLIYGGDVSYSLSPKMHNAAYETCGMRHWFEKHSSDTLVNLARFSQDENFGGAAITQPFKTAVLSILDGLSIHARAIGAVNTVLPIRELDVHGQIPDDLETLKQRGRRGKIHALYGHNTDWIGIRACIRKSLSPANAIRPQSSSLVCGAGGMARAAVYALISLGVRKIFIINRSIDSARALASHFNELIQAGEIGEISFNDVAKTKVSVIESREADWPAMIRQPTIVVNCIPTETIDGFPIEFSLPQSWLQSPTGGVALEVAYRRENTSLMSQMRGLARHGWIFLDGYDVLPEQAFSQFELFTGRRAPRLVIRNEVTKHLVSSNK